MSSFSELKLALLMLTEVFLVFGAFLTGLSFSEDFLFLSYESSSDFLFLILLLPLYHILIYIIIKTNYIDKLINLNFFKNFKI